MNLPKIIQDNLSDSEVVDFYEKTPTGYRVVGVDANGDNFEFETGEKQ